MSGDGPGELAERTGSAGTTSDLHSLLGAEMSERFGDARVVGGSASRVLVAHDRRLDRLVAVKVLLGGGLQRNAAPAEAVVQAALSDHPHVLTLLDACVTDAGLGYLVLEHAPGGTLGGHRGSPLPLEELLARGVEVASALAATHAAGFVHRDVKPSNVLISADGTARLADFGIASRAEDSLGTLDNLQGSLRYVAPELFDGASPSPANDVYSLALTLWSLATAQVPFGDDDMPPSVLMARMQSESVTFATAGLDDVVSPAVLDLLDAALNREPKERPTAAELEAALRDELELIARAGTSALGGMWGGRRRSPRDRRRRRRLTAAALVAFLVVSIAVGRPLLRGGDVAAAPTTPSYCEVHRETVDERVRLFERVASELEVATSPTEVIRHLVTIYPRRFAGVIRPWLVRTASLPGQGDDMSLSITELQDLALADAMRSLTGGKAFIFDGEDGSFDPDDLPGELREPARIVSEAGALAGQLCPEVAVNLRASKARMSSSILSNLSDPAFMNDFFSKPASLELFGDRQISLMISIARPFLEGLLRDHWDFFIHLCDRRPDIRAATAFDHPDLFLVALQARPDLLQVVQRPAWITDISRGYARLSPAARLGVMMLHRPQLVALGLGPK